MSEALEKAMEAWKDPSFKTPEYGIYSAFFVGDRKGILGYYEGYTEVTIHAKMDGDVRYNRKSYKLKKTFNYYVEYNGHLYDEYWIDQILGFIGSANGVEEWAWWSKANEGTTHVMVLKNSDGVCGGIAESIDPPPADEIIDDVDGVLDKAIQEEVKKGNISWEPAGSTIAKMEDLITSTFDPFDF